MAFAWQVAEDIKYKKGLWWYAVSLIVLAILIWWSVSEGKWFGNQNYIFVVFLILFYLVILLFEYKQPALVDFVITPDGVKWGKRFYYYKEFENFYIVYQEAGVKNIYFEFINPFRGRLIISLDDQDAVAIREYLLSRLNEDLDREAEPFSEQLRRWLKM